MPFIMLPTVEYEADDAKKSPLPMAVSHSSSIEERQAKDWIFTRFPTKPDTPGKDLSLRQQCGQQQPSSCSRRTRKDDGVDVCDLNRYSIPRSQPPPPPPSSLSRTPHSYNVIPNRIAEKEERTQDLTIPDPRASLAPSLFSPSSSEMVNDIEKKSLNTSPAADTVFHGRTQIALVTLIRQLSHVTTHADAIFQRISTDVSDISEQSQRLKSRLHVLQVHADSILGKKAAKPGSPISLIRYTNVKNHYRSVESKDEVEYKEQGCGLFTPTTRSSAIVALYESADADRLKNSQPQPSVEHCGTQTDDLLRPTSGTSQFTNQQRPTSLVATTPNVVESPAGIHQRSSTSNATGREPEEERGQRIHNDIADSSTSKNVNSASESSTTKATLVHSTQSAIDATILAINTTSGAALRRRRKTGGDYAEFINRPPPQQQRTEHSDGTLHKRSVPLDRHSRFARRNTVVGYEVDMENDQSTSPEQQRTEDFNGTTGDSIANEVVYEFAPFYRRRNKQLLSTNFFSSLRRVKKEKRVISSPPMAVSSTPIKDSPEKSGLSSSMRSSLASPTADSGMEKSQKTAASSAIKGLKQLFQRSASLRRPKRDRNDASSNSGSPTQPSNAAEGIEESRSVSSMSASQKNYCLKPKTNLPISTASQVIHLAAQLRDHRPSNGAVINGDNDQRFSKLSSSSSRDSAYSSCGKKQLRPPSLVSLASLDFGESKVNGWYRQGYQLEYPDELVPYGANHAVSTPRQPPATSTPTAKVPQITNGKSRDTSNSSPHSEASSFVDSYFSCDKDGYFTTMHRDCGLKKPCIKSDNDPEPSLDSAGTSDDSLDTVTERIGPRNAPSVVQKYRPPNLSLVQTTTLDPTSSPAPTSAASEAEIKFDLWLMSKFHAEQRMRHFREQRITEPTVNVGTPPGRLARNFGRFSLPRSKNVQKSKNDFVADYIRSLQQDTYSRTHTSDSCTMPRKTVRFCE